MGTCFGGMMQSDEFREFVRGQYRFEAEKEISHTSVCIAGTLWKAIKELEGEAPKDVEEITEALYAARKKVQFLPNMPFSDVPDLPAIFRIVSQELFMAVLSGNRCSCGGAQKSSQSASRRRRRIHSRLVRSSLSHAVPTD